MYSINKSTLGLAALSAFSVPLGAQAPAAPTETELLAAISQFVKETQPNGVLPEPVVPTAHLRNDFGLDSLDAVELLMKLEEKYFVEVPLDDDEDWEKVGGLMRMISKQTDQFANPDRIRFLHPHGAKARIGSSYRGGRLSKGLYHPTENRLVYPTTYERIYRLTPPDHKKTAVFVGADGEFSWDVFDENGVTILTGVHFQPECRRVDDTLLIITKGQNGQRVAYSLQGVPLSPTALLDLFDPEE